MTAETERARLRDLVRRGYDAISYAYRTDDGESNAASAESTAAYGVWIDELAIRLPTNALVLDLGCGAGVPATKALAEHGFRVIGLDISAAQVHRASHLVADAAFVQADMATWQCRAGVLDAVTSFYALIHLPLEDQRPLLARIRGWLCDGGYLLAIVGSEGWSGIEDYFGAQMFWDHADTQSYLRWLSESRLDPVWHRFVPEGSSGHTLVLAQAV